MIKLKFSYSLNRRCGTITWRRTEDNHHNNNDISDGNDDNNNILGKTSPLF